MEKTNVVYIKEHIIHQIKEYFKKAGKKKAVIGLSGGLDSSLTCYLVAEALGPRNVFAYYLPFNSSELRDVKKVVESTKVNFEVVNIKKAVDILTKILLPKDVIERGNIIARVRMIVLYNEAHKKNALVVGTSNKSEWLLGYFTKHGDVAADLLPLGDLYKTQLKSLGYYLGLPKSIVEKAPSAGLWKGQTDEKELGVSYKIADSILQLFEKKLTIDKIIRSGAKKENVKKVLGRVRKTEHKRVLPYTIKIK